jgi:FkbM family methyltransferase
MATKVWLRKIVSRVDTWVATSNLGPLVGIIERVWNKRRVSYSSHAEDLILNSIFARHKFVTGEQLTFSYIDVGAWRPMRGSNTYFFYKQGIRGTVVEPNANLARLWKNLRPHDFLLPYACSVNSNIEFNQFSKLAPSNTGNLEFATEISGSQSISIVDRYLVSALSLNEIVSKHLELFPERFILDLDIEGDDFSVLEKFVLTGVFRPIVILIEDHFEFGLHESPITRHLEDSNYALVGRTVITSIFVDLSSDLSASQFGI